MDENGGKKSEAVQKWASIAIALFGVIIPAALGFWNYSVAAQRDSKKPFLDKQLSLYFEASQAASQLATLPNGKNREQASIKFWELYYGQLSLVESPDVESAMDKFGEALRRYEKKESGLRELQQLSLKLSHACRDSLSESWGVSLEELTGQKRQTKKQ